MQHDPAANPFATSRIRPGALQYQFSSGDSLQQLYQRFQQQHFQGAILGPHGVGKSTLLVDFNHLLQEQGLLTQLLRLNAGQSAFESDWAEPLRHQLANLAAHRDSPENISSTSRPAAVVIVDGYEQLGWWPRWRLHQTCRQHRWGLLVTSHHPTQLSTLIEVVPSLERAQALVSQLTQGYFDLITPADVAEHYAANQQNIRETFFSLYDLYHQRLQAERDL